MIAKEASSHRADIDGLRGVAVLAVIIYHIDPTLLLGGFLGVDVFFVLSGYLITTNLAKEAQGAGSINLRNFFQRRIKRLAPAALSTILVVLVVCVSVWQAYGQR
jgi:peptidoglycan/LPS O-acetylase OafA/YrhL